MLGTRSIQVEVKLTALFCLEELPGHILPRAWGPRPHLNLVVLQPDGAWLMEAKVGDLTLQMGTDGRNETG